MSFLTHYFNGGALRFYSRIKDVPAGLLQDSVELPYDNVDDFISAAIEPDGGGPTTNLNTIAKRYASSGQEPTAEIINTLQSRTGGNRVTPEQVALFKEAFEQHTHSVPLPLGTKGMDTLRSMSPINKGTPGCYIITSLLDNSQGVGSSMNLALRLRSHYSRNNNTRISKRLITQGRDNFTAQVVRLPLGVPQTQSAVVAFEQYLFLRLNPSINLFFIAGSYFISEDEILRRQVERGTPVYIYYKGKLVAQTLTVKAAADILNVERANVRAAAKNDSYLTDFKITLTPIADRVEDLMDIPSLKALLASKRSNNESKPFYLYIRGALVGSYNVFKELQARTGFTVSEIEKSLSNRNGLYRSDRDILFTRDLLQGAPLLEMSDSDILKHCSATRSRYTNKHVYAYQDSKLIATYTSPYSVLNRQTNFPISRGKFYADLKKNGKCQVGDTLYTVEPVESC
nr:hypothetical protein LI453_mgp09 [Auricularia auricula-judae]QUX33083.1 hypothetical protein [Auricularia auricula-judae]